MSVQSAWRRRLAQRVLARLRRAAVMATETEVERCAREERERSALLREKLLRRRRQASKQPTTTTMTTRERASPPPPQAVCPRRALAEPSLDVAPPTVLPPTLAVHLADTDADEAMGAPSTTRAAEGGADFLAAMRHMVSELGGHDSDDEYDER